MFFLSAENFLNFRNDSGKIDIAYETLSKCLKSKSSKGRLKGLTLVSEFFQRSAVFRRLFCDNLQV